ncbi:unnamed protein product [Allacma fusca]|uniref:Uncharacterized protein n=1 Tax=Allacma fusca TaxID=39272 RepID=A0A8J2PMH0_9HEXA|nr:unnamed protein product [Allacma fusca]
MARLKSLWSWIHFFQILSAFYCILQITSGSYVEQYLESVEVCSAGSGGLGLGVLSEYIGDLAKKRVRLANFPNNTVVIKMSRWPAMWSSFFNFRCQFTVTAPKKHGVMMTVRSMHLRTRRDSKSCRDYFKFKQDNEVWTNPVCGDLSKDDNSKNPEDLVGPRFISSSKGEIDVMFHTSGEDPDDDHKPFSLEILFTAFADCSTPQMTKLVAEDKYRQCSSIRKMSCIPKALYCDGVINCGFDDDFGADELNCATENKHNEIKRSISIYVFAVTAVSTLVIVIVFVLLVCCCMRKFQKTPRPTTGNRSRALDMEFSLSTAGPPSAPPLTLERSVNSSSTMKSEDLPPPYDALFPSSDVTITQPVQKKK